MTTSVDSTRSESESARLADAIELMMRFAERTGLTSGRPPRRYLWTDAFGVCNFLGLARATGDAQYRELALRLVDQVHHVLGRHRLDDLHRTGWISGLEEAEGAEHPTRGGLRIGKPLPEREANEPIDAELEWDRDGQYFHYLTKWMHALDQVARATGETRFHVWARELAEAAHGAFVHGALGNKRMTWKLSIDLSRALVPSMGQHDPLDGFVTCTQLDATAAALRLAPRPSLTEAALDFASMLDLQGLATSDPLGLGGLLVDACRLAQLDNSPGVIASLLAAALVGLKHYAAVTDPLTPATLRLGFRELGLSVGLAGVSMLRTDELARRLDASGRARLAGLARHLPVRTQIESFWLRPVHRRAPTWIEHGDINDVMLATSLAPDGFLSLGLATTKRDR